MVIRVSKHWLLIHSSNAVCSPHDFLSRVNSPETHVLRVLVRGRCVYVVVVVVVVCVGGEGDVTS